MSDKQKNEALTNAVAVFASDQRTEIIELGEIQNKIEYDLMAQRQRDCDIRIKEVEKASFGIGCCTISEDSIETGLVRLTRPVIGSLCATRVGTYVLECEK